MTRGLATEAWRRGFTLVELLYVLVIVGILAGFALPRIDVNRARADGGALQAAATLMTAQRRAVLQQHDVRILFDVDGGALRVHQDADNDGNESPGELLSIARLGEGVVFGRSGAPGAPGLPGADVVTFAEDDGMPVLTFHRNGSASEEGGLYVTARNGQAEHARAVSVERSTGRTSCWSYRQGSWQEGC